MKSTKKTYLQPKLNVVMLDVNDLIATSNEDSSKRVNLSLDLDEIEEEGYAD